MPPKPSQGDFVVGAHRELWKVLEWKDPFPSDHLARRASYTVKIEEGAVKTITGLKEELVELKGNVERRVVEGTRELNVRVEELERDVKEKEALVVALPWKVGR